MYLLFTGINYYPVGGARDFTKSYSREDEAIQAGNDFLTEQGSFAWVNVFCTETLEVVWMKEVECNGDTMEHRYHVGQASDD